MIFMDNTVQKRIEENIRYTSNWWGKQNPLRTFFSYTEKFHAHTFLKAFTKYSANEKYLIDIGFGDAYLIEKIFTRDKNEKVTVIGTDISIANVTAFTKRAIGKGLSHAYALSVDPFQSLLPIKSESIDYVNCSHVLEHVVSDSELVKEIHRILKPDGTAFFMVPLNEKGWDVPTHVRKYTNNSIKNVIEKKFVISFTEENDAFSRMILYCAVHKNFFTLIFKRSLIFLLCLLPFPVQSALDRLFRSFGFKASQILLIAGKK
ncbi:MAG: methyltransferase domain-containing protein [Chitinivibrionales bacterium]|nr:methyltransferase domain-containing protein [Chitinivibrionales bacterium]